MCGIAGFLGFYGDAATVLRSMVETLNHRGPDAQNYWRDDAHHIALGHARLSVVELSDAGSQPMLSGSGRYVISYNGEIYNHREIRKALEAAGKAPCWKGNSDTETLLCAIDSWGLEAALEQCIGMFAFALWDKSECTLSLIRDRFGEKPLYYKPTCEGVVFASELSSLKKFPDSSLTVSPLSVRHLAESDYIPAPLSIYRGVFKLLPGSLITFNSAGFLTTRQWWSPYDTASKNHNAWQGSESDALVELEARLHQCVQRQMISDVPLGAFLSGGIDSSLIVALMQQYSDSPVKTYTIGFNEHEFDEAQYARQVAQCLGTEHTEHYVTDREVLDLIPQLPSTYSEPFADSSQLPTMLVSKLARQGVTVALTGDAGDEIFAGYTRHTFVSKHWENIQKIPYPLRKLGGRLVQVPTESQLDRLFGVLPMTSNWTRIGEKIKRSGYALSANSLRQLYGYLTRLENSEHVLGFDEADGTSGQMGPQASLLAKTTAAIDDNLGELDPMRWLMVKDQSDYLPNDILAKVDRAAMAYSLETRAPFLDHTLVEFSQSLPVSMLVEGNKGKKLLRNVLENYVPTNLYERPKMGFSIPVYQLIKGPLKDWADAHLTEAAVKRSGQFDAHQVQKIWQEHLSGTRNNIMKLWPVLMYQAWSE